MSAGLVQTDQKEGENDNHDDGNNDIIEWLKQHRLLKFKQKIQELEITMDDLLNFTEEQIELIACPPFITPLI